ncbi:MAG TPA: hypothetical protein VL986_02100 [Terracidiphilus sp.]|nr:hypothetical protein [Terracidiphilus sp.]
MPPRAQLFALVCLATICGVGATSAPTPDDQALPSDIESIGSALNSPDHRPVHIIYVHGINQVGAGDSSALRDAICDKLHLCNKSDWKSTPPDFPDQGEFAPNMDPPPLEYLGKPVWKTKDEWFDAAPFVAHWAIQLKGYSSPLVVDEINWWPLVLALKCEHVVKSEASLAGPDKQLLGVCSDKSKQDPDNLGRFHAWLSPEDAAQLAKKPERAVLINRNLKTGLVDWGFSDAFIGVGPLAQIIRDGMRQLMTKCAQIDPNGLDKPNRKNYDWKKQLNSGSATDQTFIGVTHSLGSYLLFNTMNLEDSSVGADDAQSQETQSEKAFEDDAVQYIFERMSLIYFFANQLRVLEFTDLEGAPAAKGASAHVAGAASPPSTQHFNALVNRWSKYRQNYVQRNLGGSTPPAKKVAIVAWSDPGDLLTWRVPPIDDVEVFNLYAHNAIGWFWLFESPLGAHDNYAKNKAVLRVMFPNR